MAIYSLHLSSVNRSSGSSSTAALSYIASMRVPDERTGEVFYGFGRRERVLETGTVLPQGAPVEFGNPVALFNSIEMEETRANAVPAKKLMVALPREFDLDTQRQVVVELIEEQITRRGYAATWALHCDQDGSNPHAHILIANRQIEHDGQWRKVKSRRVYALDEHGQRIPVIDPRTGQQKTDKRNRKQWKRVLAYQNPMGDRKTLLDMRQAWAEICNSRLPEQSHISHLSLQDQGIDREPTIHEGVASREMAERGETSDRVAINQDIRHRNRLIESLKRQLSSVGRAIRQWKAQLATRAVRVDPSRFLARAEEQAKATRQGELDGLEERIQHAERDLYNQQYGFPGSLVATCVRPHIEAVRTKILEVERTGFWHRHRARTELKALARSESQALAKEAPWLSDPVIPTDLEQLTRASIQCDAETRHYQEQPLRERISALKDQAEQLRKTPIEASTIQELARKMAQEEQQRKKAPAPVRRRSKPAQPAKGRDAFINALGNATREHTRSGPFPDMGLGFNPLKPSGPTHGMSR